MPLFWVSFGVVCLWYLLISLPIVIDDLLKWEHAHGRVDESLAWQAAVSHLRVTFHLTLVMQLLKPLGCNYAAAVTLADDYDARDYGGSRFGDVGSGAFDGYDVDEVVADGAANGTATEQLLVPVGDGDWWRNGSWHNASGATRGRLEGASGIACWDEEGPQPAMALAAMAALAFYLLTAHVVGDDGALTKARQGATLDVRHAELFTSVANTLGIAAAASLVLLQATAPVALCALLLCISLLLVGWTLGYRRLLGTPPCCLACVTALRAAGYGLAAWAALCCLIEADGSTLAPELTSDGLPRTDALRPTETLLLCGWAAIVAVVALRLLAASGAARKQRWADAANLRPCASALRLAEERWRRDGLLSPLWAAARRPWARRVRGAARCAELADCVALLEQHVRPDVFVLDSGFVAARRAWLEQLLAARTAPQLDRALATLSAAVQDARGRRNGGGAGGGGGGARGGGGGGGAVGVADPEAIVVLSGGDERDEAKAAVYEAWSSSLRNASDGLHRRGKELPLEAFQTDGERVQRDERGDIVASAGATAWGGWRSDLLHREPPSGGWVAARLRSWYASSYRQGGIRWSYGELYRSAASLIDEATLAPPPPPPPRKPMVEFTLQVPRSGAYEQIGAELTQSWDGRWVQRVCRFKNLKGFIGCELGDTSMNVLRLRTGDEITEIDGDDVERAGGITFRQNVENRYRRYQPKAFKQGMLSTDSETLIKLAVRRETNDNESANRDQKGPYTGFFCDRTGNPIFGVRYHKKDTPSDGPGSYDLCSTAHFKLHQLSEKSLYEPIEAGTAVTGKAVTEQPQSQRHSPFPEQDLKAEQPQPHSDEVSVAPSGSEGVELAAMTTSPLLSGPPEPAAAASPEAAPTPAAAAPAAEAPAAAAPAAAAAAEAAMAPAAAMLGSASYSAAVDKLLAELEQADTNFERFELVEETKSSLGDALLTCAEVGAIAGTFTFSSKKRAALVMLYPSIAAHERPGFVDVLEEVLSYDFDRKDVLRDLHLG